MVQYVRKDERCLFEITADFINRMTELENLRSAVRLAEAAKALQSEELPNRSFNSKVVDLFAGPQLRV
jgi:hypothetical protein